MFQRIRTGWQLTKAAVGIIRQDKEMVVYPILTIAAILLLATLFFFIALASDLAASLAAPSFTKVTFYLFIALFLVAAYTISIFFEGAVIASTLQRCEGKNPTIASGLRAPTRRIHQLVLWAIIMTVVAVFIQIVRNLGKGKSRGAQVASNVGATTFQTAWRLLSFFVIPIILFENTSVFPALARSKQLFVKTWGENISAQVTTSALFILLAFVGVVPLLFAIFLGGETLLQIALVLFSLYLIALIIITTTINGILVALLYAYATHRKIPKEYGITPQMMITQR